MDGFSQTEGQAFSGVETQSFTQIAIVGGLFASLAWLMARLQPGSVEGFAGLGVTFLAYLAPTILAFVAARRRNSAGQAG